MKKYFPFMLSVLLFTVIAQNTVAQSNSGYTQDLLWAINAQGDVSATYKNPDAVMPQQVNATATCFCVISYEDLTGQKTRSGVCMDLTSIVNTTYSGLNPMKDENRKDCTNKCSNAAYSLTPAQKQAIADCACAAGKGNGTSISAFGAVGTKEYQSDQKLGNLVNTPAVSQTTCKCPTGWLANTTNVDGGVTADGKCKKLVCGPINTGPFPANGTQVGTWGFTWGNALYAWGSTANGGAAVCNTLLISPAICKIQ